MADLISRSEVIEKLKKAYWDKNIQSAKNDPCVIDAMTDWAIRIVNEMPLESPWHTGIPTEEGWYLCAYGDNFYCANYWQGGTWKNQWGGTLLAYQKIEPYKED